MAKLLRNTIRSTQKKRLAKILQLIEQYDVENQDVLIKLLQKEGFHVTQATVSRDIKEMRLLKTLDSNGTYKYSAEMVSAEEQQSHSYLFSTAVTGVDCAHSLVVIKTQIGMAQAVCAALDATDRVGVLGSIAGDDTIFVATRTDSVAVSLVTDIKKMMTAKNNSFQS